MAKRRKKEPKQDTWRARLLPLAIMASDWLSGLNRFTVCSKCKLVLDSEEPGAGSTLTWDFGKDGWICPKCSRDK